MNKLVRHFFAIAPIGVVFGAAAASAQVATPTLQLTQAGYSDGVISPAQGNQGFWTVDQSGNASLGISAGPNGASAGNAIEIKQVAGGANNGLIIAQGTGNSNAPGNSVLVLQDGASNIGHVIATNPTPSATNVITSIAIGYDNTVLQTVGGSQNRVRTQLGSTSPTSQGVYTSGPQGWQSPSNGNYPLGSVVPLYPYGSQLVPTGATVASNLFPGLIAGTDDGKSVLLNTVTQNVSGAGNNNMVDIFSNHNTVYNNTVGFGNTAKIAVHAQGGDNVINGVEGSASIYGMADAQQGNFNGETIDVQGDYNTVGVGQIGNGNTAYTEVMGTGNTVHLTQANDSTCNNSTIGCNNATLAVFGNNQTLIASQNGNNNYINVGITGQGGRLEIDQGNSGNIFVSHNIVTLPNGFNLTHGQPGNIHEAISSTTQMVNGKSSTNVAINKLP